MKLSLKAFSTLRPHLKEQNIGYLGELYECKEGITIKELVAQLGFRDEEVEGAFVNYMITPKSFTLKEGDRVALVPPGTPGSCRLMLGIKEGSHEEENR
ncbi:MoaD/ThiS family protein [Wolinella succinogenes]|uniref:MoaD/ThiS family protein n=1 Tax=Wolinella succinogenes TaxID=844 RepID=UPI002409E967|nr:MoaD/ThiS family protein [Wolinella succinogenes]